MSAPNGEALVSAINRLLLRLDVRGVSANEIVACIKPLIADSEAAAVEAADFALQQERNIHMTTIAERDRLRAEVELGEQLQAATEASLKTVTGERDQLRAEVERLKFYIATTIQPDEYAKVIKDLRAEVERLGRATTNGQVNWMQESDRQNARAERAEAELAAAKLLLNEETDCAEAVEAAIVRQYARAERAEAELAAERAIVSRIWVQLGSPTYAQLKGRSIYCLIDEIKAELAAERARLDWLSDNVEEIYSKDQHGIVYLSGDNIRAAIDAAMKEGAK